MDIYYIFQKIKNGKEAIAIAQTEETAKRYIRMSARKNLFIEKWEWDAETAIDWVDW